MGESTRETPTRNPFSPFTLAFATALLLGVGAALGYVAAVQPVRSSIQRTQKIETVGSFLDPALHEGASTVYANPARALPELHDYVWTVPHAPAPFVGSVPMPGVHRGVHINAAGLRAPREVATPKSEGAVRVFLVGGSTAFGVGAPNDDSTIGAYLQAELQERLGPAIPVEVFTAANPGWASAHEHAFIAGRIAQWEPDLVIALSGTNDAFWASEDADPAWFRNYGDEHAYQLLSLVYRRAGLSAPPDVATALPRRLSASAVAERVRTHALASAAALDAVDAQLLYALQPALGETHKPLTDWERFRTTGIPEAQYAAKCFAAIHVTLRGTARPNLHYADLRPVFDGVERAVFLDHYHFGDAGNAIVAGALAAHAAAVLAGAAPAPAPP